MTVVDAGANIDYFTVLAAKKVGADGLVVPFEPEATNFKLLSKSLQANQFRNGLAYEKDALKGSVVAFSSASTAFSPASSST